MPIVMFNPLPFYLERLSILLSITQYYNSLDHLFMLFLGLFFVIAVKAQHTGSAILKDFRLSRIMSVMARDNGLFIPLD